VVQRSASLPGPEGGSDTYLRNVGSHRTTRRYTPEEQLVIIYPWRNRTSSYQNSSATYRH
jgi:hypothetical protein